MKAIIPVAGAGTKLRPHTYTQPKALIPLAGKTILSIIIDQLEEAGITEFVFVIGYLGEKIQHYVQKKYPHLTCHFVQQNLREGTGHAILLTKNVVGDDEILIVLGDTICEGNIRELIASPVSQLGLKKVDDPRSFGVAELNDAGDIARVVEKPQIPKSNLALVGIYKIKETDQLYDCLERNMTEHKRSHDEFQLTDALQCMIEHGVQFTPFKVSNWFDCGRKETLLETNAILLSKYKVPANPILPYENAIIIPPVSIGEGCNIKNSIIGPNVAIGDNTVINYSIVKDSIIGSYSNLYEVVLKSSLIGSDANIRGLSQSLNIGDNTEIDLG
ncbi:sugar phosphate nucleotidyltransferase [Chitinophaga sancti]|uniref:Glucose-1-phosphate thymidylyltransferase n=1 Tax=Chitinophaga sancti TaxID=1004 RepID=A0A1K1PKB3_9BACT|nr:sugar phosphate nucleotidyltransferase [Chitinophaga sancti]WQD59483.1 sugar phosphate nucleotidyltransferase [Chitinophaga sancti]WQG88383.1 sugar phosphate nucleotidyltransferase [Chitinophaga sancti]SFW48071.1 glucose-1-phosphate thymidylyltransferase [Chitinophaga sancti]